MTFGAGLPAPMPEFQDYNSSTKVTASTTIQSPKSSKSQQSSIFLSGKPYESEGQAFLFLYRSLLPDSARWSTADPSGFPDGANNIAYIDNSPTNAIDFQGLVKKVLWLVGLPGDAGPMDQWSWTEIQSAQSAYRQQLVDWDNQSMSLYNSHYLDDGDSFDFNSFSNPSAISGFGSYDKVYIAAHGDEDVNGNYNGNWWVGNTSYSTATFTSYANVEMIYGCNPTDGLIGTSTLVGKFKEPTRSYLYDPTPIE